MDELRDRCLARLVSFDVTPDVVVWFAETSPISRDLVALIVDSGLLADGDRRAASRLVPGPRRDALIVRRLVRRVVVAAAIDVGVDAVSIDVRCTTCTGTDHGRPSIAGGGDQTLSTSSSDRFVAVAIARQPVGIDVERFDAPGFDAPAFDGSLPEARPDGWAAVCDLVSRQRDGPVSDALVWTAVESLTKGLGLGLLAGESDVARALDAWSLTPIDLAPALAGHVAVPSTDPTVSVVDLSSEIARCVAGV